MNKKLVVVDCGKNTSTLLNKGKIHTFSHNKLLGEITDLPKGTKVVCEEAHLGTPRRGLSKAQPYTDLELLPFYAKCKDNGIDLSFFPQQSTFRAQQYYRTKHGLSEEEFPKSDDNDPLALFELLSDFPEISLSKPKESFDKNPVREEGNDLKRQLNDHLNWARASEPKAYEFEDDGCRDWINENIEQIAKVISPMAQEVFELTDENRYKKTKKINLNKIKMTQFYSIVSTLIDYDGELRQRPSTGSPPGWKFIQRYVLSMSPFHRKGGVARSNLYHHGIKNWHKKQCRKHGRAIPEKGGRGVFIDDQDAFFLKCRADYCKSIREVFQVVRDILSNV